METNTDKNPADILITRYLNSESSDTELHELVEWIKLDKRNKHYFDEYCEIWITAKAVAGNTGYFVQEGFWKFRQKIKDDISLTEKRDNKVLIRNIMKYAAIFIIAFASGSLIFYQPSVRQNYGADKSFSELTVPLGSRAVFSMTDGTIVTLNAGSRLKYGMQFGIFDREVQLEGEGYFKVAKDTSIPFVVKTPYLNITALGTEFNVKAYSADSIIETTLVNGSVKIDPLNNDNRGKIMELKPNQKLTYYKKTSEIFEERPESKKSTIEKIKPAAVKKEILGPGLVKECVNVEPVVSWKENRWIFEKQTLAQIATDLERKFDVKIVFESEHLKTYRFSGTIIAEPIEQVLEFMSISSPIDFRLKGRTVTLSENKYYDKLRKSLYNQNN
jgi:ferric-dicitrate binding protein FerR (iron transport regulator)